MKPAPARTSSWITCISRSPGRTGWPRRSREPWPDCIPPRFPAPTWPDQARCREQTVLHPVERTADGPDHAGPPPPAAVRPASGQRIPHWNGWKTRRSASPPGSGTSIRTRYPGHMNACGRRIRTTSSCRSTGDPFCATANDGPTRLMSCSPPWSLSLSTSRPANFPPSPCAASGGPSRPPTSCSAPTRGAATSWPITRWRS